MLLRDAMNAATARSNRVNPNLDGAAVWKGAREHFDGYCISLPVTKCRKQHRAIEDQAVNVNAAKVRGINWIL